MGMRVACTAQEDAVDDSTTNKAQGAWDQVKGKTKETVGDVTDNESMQASGKADQMKGKAQEKYGDAQGKFDDVTDKLKNKDQ